MIQTSIKASKPQTQKSPRCRFTFMALSPTPGTVEAARLPLAFRDSKPINYTSTSRDPPDETFNPK